jgi:hypothetical protein
LERVEPHRTEVSWGSLREHVGWVKQLRCAEARQVATVARHHPAAEVMAYVQHLRDASVHRRPLTGAIVEVHSAESPLRASGEVKVGMIRLAESIDPVDANAPSSVPGLVDFGADQYLGPSVFADGLARQLAILLDQMLADVEWPNSEGWWENDASLDRRFQRELIGISSWPIGDE